ncbi:MULTISPECIES: hypothetical protein [Flavobacterium]|uniref:hypothetical protein n=1 Tax=Flavobacterium TaxID=237 RepID=UPI001FCB6D18|nr:MULTISPECIES: hypothetical protein [Flavobacterium]UOK43383.1 hypothetical protein LZF87_04485 [Flavobacterium enshiense]
MNKLHSSFVVLIFSILFYNATLAQEKKSEYINVAVGLGMCAPYDEADLTGSGFYAQGEYVWNLKSWFAFRPYAGVIIASGDSDEPGMEEYKIKSNAFLLGAKARISAPIPYVAPFLESGVGLSAGSFQTYTPFTNLKKNGVVTHIPFSVGLAIGRRHNFEIKFTYYYHPTAEQFSGAFAGGFSIPLNKK